ncbi:MAG: ATP-binding protein [Pseudomonadota bacterium]
MQRILPGKMDRRVLKAIESFVTLNCLDDILESTLFNLLDMEHVSKIEIRLFNENDRLISVASGRNSSPDADNQKDIVIQSWLMESTIPYHSGKIKLPRISSVFVFPLIEIDRLMGFLVIHLDKILIPDKDYLSCFYLVGLQLAANIKKIRLSNEIREAKTELQNLSAINLETQQRVTSLSKELFAISAISAKINQSMDFNESLYKSMHTIKNVFKESRMLIYTRDAETEKAKLSASDCSGNEIEPLLFRKIEREYLKEILSIGKPVVKQVEPELHYVKISGCSRPFRMIIGVPLKSKQVTMGVMFLLREAKEPFDHAGLRLLSGMANIMGMAIENKNLYRQSLQKKDEAAFLFESIVKFNAKLDLKETLKSVSEKGVEFIGKNCRLYLFTETRIPLILSTYAQCCGKKDIVSTLFPIIHPKELIDIYGLLLSQDRPLLIKNVNRSKKIPSEMKPHFRSQHIHSLVSIVLKVRKRKLGLLLVVRAKAETPFDGHDLSFAEAMGSAASLAIENARAYTSSQEMSDFLEQKIIEKTTQIQQLQEQKKNREEIGKDIVFRVNKKNRYVFVNKVMELLTGFSKDELCHEEFSADSVVAEEDRRQINYYFKKILRKELPLAKGLEYRQLNRKGEDHLISLTIYPDVDELGQISGIDCVGVDITEKKRLEAELEKARELALLGEFSSAIAHQIRNPLGNILMGTKLLQQTLGLVGQLTPMTKQAGDRTDADRHQLTGIFSNLSDGIHNLNRVVTELLDYTKTLKLSRSLQRIDILLEETLSMYDDAIRHNRIKVEKRYDQELPSLSLDAVLMSQVFQNVFHNAIHSMPDGGRLTVSCERSRQIAGYSSIQICDSGVGIKVSELDKIFRPFFTSKESGTGLGLSLAHRIVEAHQGSIWASNNMNHGATIHILLPLDPSVDIVAHSEV